MLYVLDTLRLLYLTLTNLYAVITNILDASLSRLASWYLVEELFIGKYKRLPYHE
jgi:hypothetical protein